MLSGFENDEATFFVEREVATAADAYGDNEPVYDWVPLSLDDTEWDYVDGEVVYEEADVDPSSVRSEQRDADYVREVYGEWPMEVYRLYVDPFDIGEQTGRSYECLIEADDRVELASSEGQFSMQAPKLERLDSTIPEFVQIEVTRVEV